MNKFFGVGIFNVIMIWVAVVLLTVGMKAIVNKYNTPDGVKSIINAV
jgi:hypothetical protein